MSAKVIPENDRMQLLVHRENGTRHLVKSEWGNPVCGEYPNAMKYKRAGCLVHNFPEDFGDLDDDCQKCAEMYDPEDFGVNAE